MHNLTRKIEETRSSGGSRRRLKVVLKYELKKCFLILRTEYMSG